MLALSVPLSATCPASPNLGSAARSAFASGSTEAGTAGAPAPSEGGRINNGAGAGGGAGAERLGSGGAVSVTAGSAVSGGSAARATSANENENATAAATEIGPRRKLVMAQGVHLVFIEVEPRLLPSSSDLPVGEAASDQFLGRIEVRAAERRHHRRRNALHETHARARRAVAADTVIDAVGTDLHDAAGRARLRRRHRHDLAGTRRRPARAAGSRPTGSAAARPARQHPVRAAHALHAHPCRRRGTAAEA